jgi:predicted transcriptional regulator
MQISHELGIAHQLVAKHLHAMENAGIVTSTPSKSPNGPKRKIFAPAESVSVTVDLASNLLRARSSSFDTIPALQTPIDTAWLLRRIGNTAADKSLDDPGKIASFSKILREIDAGITHLEEERGLLIYLRNLTLKEAAKSIEKSQTNTDTKRVVHFFLDRRANDISEISKELNLHESRVKEILTDLTKSG